MNRDSIVNLRLLGKAPHNSRIVRDGLESCRHLHNSFYQTDGNRAARARILIIVAIAISLAAASRVAAGQSIDYDQVFSKYAVIISLEAGANRFGARLQNPDGIQTWDLVSRFSILPFGICRFPKVGHLIDGALAVGIEPVFERFATQNQNYGGGGLDLRYYFVGLRVGPIVPWVNLMGAAGGTDFQVKKLNGPFMFLLQGGVGFSYLATEQWALSLGYQAEHFSNGGVEPGNDGLNSAAGAVCGVSYFF
jgi:hypothetical protein